MGKLDTKEWRNLYNHYMQIMNCILSIIDMSWDDMSDRYLDADDAELYDYKRHVGRCDLDSSFELRPDNVRYQAIIGSVNLFMNNARLAFYTGGADKVQWWFAACHQIQNDVIKKYRGTHNSYLEFAHCLAYEAHESIDSMINIAMDHIDENNGNDDAFGSLFIDGEKIRKKEFQKIVLDDEGREFLNSISCICSSINFKREDIFDVYNGLLREQYFLIHDNPEAYRQIKALSTQSDSSQFVKRITVKRVAEIACRDESTVRKKSKDWPSPVVAFTSKHPAEYSYTPQLREILSKQFPQAKFPEISEL